MKAPRIALAVFIVLAAGRAAAAEPERWLCVVEAGVGLDQTDTGWEPDPLKGATSDLRYVVSEKDWRPAKKAPKGPGDIIGPCRKNFGGGRLSCQQLDGQVGLSLMLDIDSGAFTSVVNQGWSASIVSGTCTRL